MPHTLEPHITLMRKFAGKLFAGYGHRFDDDLLQEILSEALLTWERQELDKKFRGDCGLTTMACLMVRNEVGAWFARRKAKKRQEPAAEALPRQEPPDWLGYTRLDRQIDLKGFYGVLTEDEKIIISYYREGWDLPEIAGETGMSVPNIEKKLQDLRCYAAQYFDTSERDVLYRRLQERLQAKREVNSKYTQKPKALA